MLPATPVPLGVLKVQLVVTSVPPTNTLNVPPAPEKLKLFLHYLQLQYEKHLLRIQ